MTKEDQILEILLENNKKLNSLEEKVDNIYQTLTLRIDALEEKINSLTLRISSLEKKFSAIEEKISVLEEKFNVLEEKINVLEEKINVLEEKINVLEEKFNALVLRVNTLEEKVDDIHHSLILLENDFHDKSSILFDEYSGNKEHLEQNEKDIKDLKTVLADHSVKLISLEVDSKKHTKQLKSLSSAK